MSRSRKVKANQPHGLRKNKPREPKKAQIIEFGVSTEEGRLTATLPIATVSEGNCFESWQKKHARHKRQKLTIDLALSPHMCQVRTWLPLRITVIRCATRFLDAHDNLRMSVKYCIDQIADCIFPGQKAGRADDDKRLNWVYQQEKSKEKYIKIIIESDKY